MKKLLAGCAVILLIGLVGLAVAGFFAYRAARPIIESAGDYLDRARELASVGDLVRNKEPFAPPASGELTADQVKRLLAVQASTRATLGDRWTEVTTRAEALHRRTAGGAEPSIGDIAAIIADVGGVLVDARRAQVAALNEQRFSTGEYRWVRLRAYEAAGVQLAGALDLSALDELARRGGSDLRASAVPLPEVPAANARLVKPHVATLQEWLPLAFLGL